MLLQKFFSEESGRIRIAPDQGSRFAKQVADDFNPLHNPDSKRFCVPGDLLFSIALSKLGLSERMCFTFTGMVGAGVELIFPVGAERVVDITDDVGKTYLRVEREGRRSHDPVAIETLWRRYVAFSGHNFPDVLVPLMRERGLMINPNRPLVIYESMSLELESLELENPILELEHTEVKVEGKRAETFLHFRIDCSGRTVGSGFKKLIQGGLRAYERDESDRLVAGYAGWKAAYKAA